MKFTIVIPNYNHGNTLSRALQSAVNQEVDEVILVDDCSTDNSLEIARSFDINIIQHPKKSENFLYALEPILRRLKTDYVVLFAADDILYPNIISIMKHNIQNYPLDSVMGLKSDPIKNPGVIFCDYDLLKEGNPPKVIQHRKFNFRHPTFLSPQEAKKRMIKCGSGRWECGVGSAIKIDDLNWLLDQNYMDLGPWQDSWGYTTIAIKSGCLYIPGTYAGFTIVAKNPSYHQRVRSNPQEMIKFRDIGKKWLNKPEIYNIVNSVPFSM